MNWFSGISIAIISIILMALCIIGGWLYVGHLQTQIKTLQIADQQAALISQQDNEQLKAALSDFKRQADIVVAERDKAVSDAKQSSLRYQQIMEVTANEDAAISPVLCTSLVRLYEPNSGSGGSALSVPDPTKPRAADLMAKSACASITQKDVAAWLETEVYPSYKQMQTRIMDIGKYINGGN